MTEHLCEVIVNAGQPIRSRSEWVGAMAAPTGGRRGH
jgi:hypothetical protein